MIHLHLGFEELSDGLILFVCLLHNNAKVNVDIRLLYT